MINTHRIFIIDSNFSKLQRQLVEYKLQSNQFNFAWRTLYTQVKIRINDEKTKLASRQL